jgi:hypothetical protein
MGRSGLLIWILLWRDGRLDVLRMGARTTRPAALGALPLRSTTTLEEPEASEHGEESHESSDSRNPSLEEVHTLGVGLGRTVVPGAKVQTGPGLADRYLLLRSKFCRGP